MKAFEASSGDPGLLDGGVNIAIPVTIAPGG